MKKELCTIALSVAHADICIVYCIITHLKRVSAPNFGAFKRVALHNRR